MLEKVKNLTKQCFEGDVTVTKVTLWLIGVSCLLAGVVYGLCIAPWTHGVTIGCNNGCHNTCLTDDEKKTEKED